MTRPTNPDAQDVIALIALEDLAMPPTVKAMPIFELDNYTRILGYYARGHHDRVPMLQAVERYNGPIEPDTLRQLDGATLRHCYARVVGDWSEGDRQSVLKWFGQPGPGAFAVTVWEY